MAYNPQDPNKMKDEEPQGEAGSPPPQLSSASGSLGPTGPSAGAPVVGSSQPKGPSASGFTNVQKYIDKNQQQGGALGEKIAGGINQTIDKATQMAGSAASGYKEQVNPDQYGFSAKTFDPMKVDKKQFANLFQAPKSTYEDNAARAAIGQAQAAAQKIGTNEGRDQLVGEQQTLTGAGGAEAGKGTAGLRYFDRLLFQGSQAGSKAITDTAKKLQDANLEQKLSEQAAIAKGVDQDALRRQAAAAQAARNTIGQSAKSLQDQIAQQTAKQRSDLQANQDAIFQALAKKQDLSDQNLQAFGLNRGQYNQILDAFKDRSAAASSARMAQLENARFNPLAADLSAPVADSSINLIPYLQKADLSGFGVQNAVTPEQLARARALEGLSQISGNQLGSLAPQKASAFNNQLGSVDFQALLNAINDRTGDAFR